MSLFNILNMSGSALQAQRAGLAVTANNIANAGTEGYHRQSVDYQTVGSYFTSGLLLGQGVTAADVMASYDRFTEERLYSEHSNYGYAEQMATAFETLETFVAVVDDGSLTSRLSTLLSSFDQLAASPWEESVRTQVLIDTGSLAAEFRRQSSALTDLQAASNDAVGNAVSLVNGYLGEIASLNAQIAALEAGGQTANDLRDQRAWAIDQVATQLDVTLDEEADGTMTMFIGGHAAVQGSEARTLAVQEDPNNGDLYEVVLQEAGNNLDITSQIRSGAIAAHLEVRDDVIPDQIAALDEMAVELMNAFNTQHQAGYDIDGNAAGALFQGTGAADIELAAGLVDNPDGLAAAADPNEVPGDGTNAALVGDIADLETAFNFNGSSMTFNEAMSSFVASIASDAAAVNAGLTLQTSITSAVEATWESTSAVSQEEEAINLIQYQDAYDAMAKVLQTTQEMLDTLMNI